MGEDELQDTNIQTIIVFDDFIMIVREVSLFCSNWLNEIWRSGVVEYISLMTISMNGLASPSSPRLSRSSTCFACSFYPSPHFGLFDLIGQLKSHRLCTSLHVTVPVQSAQESETVFTPGTGA